jgi:NAD dependent epimerase/dehydratase
MNWNGKRVLVTGAAGFIGSHLCKTLVEMGASVTAFIRYNGRGDWGNLELLPSDIRSSLEVIAGNVEDPQLVDATVKGKHVVFHLAALIGIPYSYVAPVSYVRTNVEGTLNVLEAARRWSTECIVHTSTSETYGTAIYEPINEQHPLQAQSPYSATKIAADKLCESYARSFNVPVATLRPFNTFGPRQSARAIIPCIISQALIEKRVRLGSLTPVRDLTFVDDTVQGFLRIAACSRAVGEVVNVGNGAGITIGDLANRILALLQLDVPIEHDVQRVRPEKSEVFKLICDNSRAKEWLGWTPQVSLDAGLTQVIEYIRTHLEKFRTSQYVQ